MTHPRHHAHRHSTPAIAALTAVAMGALAVGTLAIGYLAIGGLAVRNARFKRLEIDELVVRRIRRARPEPLED